MRFVLLVLFAVVACTHDAPAAPHKATTPKSKLSQKKPVKKKKMEISARITGTRPGRPPMLRFEVEVKLHNTSKDPRWFVLPAKLPLNKSGGVDTLEPRDHGGVMLARFLGTGGFYAVKLKGGARLTISKLELTSWGDDDPHEFPVQVAADITIGGKSIATWFTHDPVANAASLDASLATAGKPKDTPDGKEQPVHIDGDQIAVPLTN